MQDGDRGEDLIVSDLLIPDGVYDVEELADVLLLQVGISPFSMSHEDSEDEGNQGG